MRRPRRRRPPRTSIRRRWRNSRRPMRRPCQPMSCRPRSHQRWKTWPCPRHRKRRRRPTRISAGSADQRQLRRFLHRQGDAALAGDALQPGGQFGIELEVAADDQHRLAPARDRDHEAHDAIAGARRLQLARQGRCQRRIGEPDLQLQPARLGEALERLEALDGDARLVVAGPAVELDGQAGRSCRPWPPPRRRRRPRRRTPSPRTGPMGPTGSPSCSGGPWPRPASARPRSAPPSSPRRACPPSTATSPSSA